jgi:hypothetical protein
MTRQDIGIPDEIYDVVSVVYHALQGAETYQQYIRDAEQRGDQELAQYFRKCRRRKSGARIGGRSCSPGVWRSEDAGRKGWCAPELDVTICGVVGLWRVASRMVPRTRIESSKAIVIDKFVDAATMAQFA